MKQNVKIAKELVKLAKNLMADNDNDNLYHYIGVDKEGFLTFKNNSNQEKSIDPEQFLDTNITDFIDQMNDDNCVFDCPDNQVKQLVLSELSNYVNDSEIEYWAFFNNEDAWRNTPFEKDIINQLVSGADYDFILNDTDMLNVLEFILDNFNVLTEKNKTHAALLFIMQVDANFGNGDSYSNTPMINKFVNEYGREAIKYLYKHKKQLLTLFEYAKKNPDYLAVEEKYILKLQEKIFDILSSDFN